MSAKYEASGVYFAHVRASGKLHRKSLETTDRQLANRRLAEFRRKLGRVDPKLGKQHSRQCAICTCRQSSI